MGRRVLAHRQPPDEIRLAVPGSRLAEEIYETGRLDALQHLVNVDLVLLRRQRRSEGTGRSGNQDPRLRAVGMPASRKHARASMHGGDEGSGARLSP